MLLDEKELGHEPCSSISSTPNTTPKRPQLTLHHLSSNYKSTQNLRPSIDRSQCPSPTDEYDPSSTHPFSAFYSHPTTRTSFEQLKCSSSKIAINVYEADLEAGSRTRFSSERQPSTLAGVTGSTKSKECKVWPGRHELEQKSRAIKRTRGCTPLRKLNRKQKILVKILIALLIIGVAVGIGIGISKAVGAGIWKNNHEQARIGDNGRT